MSRRFHCRSGLGIVLNVDTAVTDLQVFYPATLRAMSVQPDNCLVFVVAGRRVGTFAMRLVFRDGPHRPSLPDCRR